MVVVMITCNCRYDNRQCIDENIGIWMILGFQCSIKRMHTVGVRAFLCVWIWFGTARWQFSLMLRLSKQSGCPSFEMPWHSLCRHSNGPNLPITSTVAPLTLGTRQPILKDMDKETTWIQHARTWAPSKLKHAKRVRMLSNMSYQFTVLGKAINRSFG